MRKEEDLIVKGHYFGLNLKSKAKTIDRIILLLLKKHSTHRYKGFRICLRK